MNICNFVKTIITRATKDLSAIEAHRENKENKHAPKYTNHLSIMERYKNYQNFMSKYPKMNVDFKEFGIKLKRLQKYVTDKKYWQNSNKDGQQNKFIEHFSLKNWEKLSNEEKKDHTLENCQRCNTTHISYSSLHLSSSSDSNNLLTLCNAATDSVLSITSPQSQSKTTRGLKTVQNLVKISQPIVEDKLKIKFQNQVKVSLSPMKSLKKKEFKKSKRL
ncbi:unnamed protein product [Mytilus edulis]|uniref:Uncharacterized protein n=1 Tax=Mytilus edulis TaxID=6550 RepID=A0A8S3TYW9_MYTED|nr:unnamed protein product [Mytilus edulis]